MTLKRRTFVSASLAALASPALTRSTSAQSVWPQKERTVKMIVPWPPGAANDALGRLIAEKIQQKFGVSSITENRVGGAGLTGTRAVVQADPDGYTFLASAFNTAVMPLVLKAASDFNPENDLEVLGRTAVAPLVCVMSAALPQKTLPEVIAAAKAEPSKWNFAISSLGSAGHLATIEFLRRAGINIQMVPYRGTQPALQDMMGGNIQLLIDPSFALLPAAMDGTKVRAIGIATKQRSVLAPDVPTMAEAGMPGYEFQSWYGIWAPKKLPADIADKVSALIRETMKEPDVVDRLRKTLIEPVSESREETRAFIRSEIVRASELLKSVNFEPA